MKHSTDRAGTLAHKEWIPGQCLCGKVRFEIKFPARWAWHDHSRHSARAHGASPVTYVGSWTKRFRLLSGEDCVDSFRQEDQEATRHFCLDCGTPVYYTRDKSPHMVNIPRALFEESVGREPRYHIRFHDRPEWSYEGEPLKALKNYPSVMQGRPKKRKKNPFEEEE